MKNKKLSSFFIVIIFFALMTFFISKNVAAPSFSKNGNDIDIKSVVIGGKSLTVDLALDDAKRGQGLSGRALLKDDEGMLFIFDLPGKYSFWMKDMNFAIDMIWMSGEGEIVYIKKDARPELFPETYMPDLDAKYVLEVVSGFSEKNNLKIGDSVSFVY